MRKMLIAAILLSVCTLSYGRGWENMTQSFSPEFKIQVSGLTAGQGPTTIHTRCITRILGRCAVEEKIRAQGRVTIRENRLESGEIWRTELIGPISGGQGYSWESNLYMEFRYTSNVSADKYEGGVFVGVEWGNLHPEGVIKVWLIADNQTSFKLRFKFVASPGHDDRANDFVVSYIAPQFRQQIADRAKSILGLSDIAIVN